MASMSRCALGPKKVAKIEQILGRKIIGASVRGGNAHFWAGVSCEDVNLLVNYKTGKVIEDSEAMAREAQNAHDRAFADGKSLDEARVIYRETMEKMIVEWTRKYTAKPQ